ncbi:MAG: Sll0314/Alr1548 family TPR repeat-containing protein [Geitlerinemataceae cyanobacterium]
MLASLLKNRPRLTGAIASLGLALAIATPALADDPFRDRNPRELNDKAVEAFEAMFKEADYPAANDALSDAVREAPEEPLVYALLAAIDYLEAGGNDLPASFSAYAAQTREAGGQLVEADPLRGNLYMAVGYFLEAGDIFLREGALRGMPAALSNVQKTFDHLDLASQENSSDPELNAIKGYMDLLLAVALPFADVNPALDRLEQYGGPTYVSLRGVAVGYRDSDRPDDAMDAVDRAIAAAPDNPELHYLKAQIFVEKRGYADSLQWFDEALDESEQLLPATVRQICRERRKATERAIRDGATVESDLPEACP